ncbi:HNH endonuclease signature motif containing protein [Haloechinothrix halophila]|uniref:HNH endonuclease signature motif containing protein n=1 Tax=Haloechinothrix halophila TaxID=1069073 RepID=UPI00146FB8D0|nr:HNH endonuclease signature motif containing protein [Haloechinothrix halophila]
MTTFIEVGSGAGYLHLPDHLVDPRPIDVERFTDHRVLFSSSEEIAGFDDGEVIDTLAAVRRLRARADAIEAHALTRLDELRDGSRYVPDEAALELRINRHATADRVATARMLTDDMPQLLAAMESGQIERHPATKITNTVTHLTGPRRREVDQRLTDKLATGKLSWLDPARLVRAARRLVTKVDPDGQTDRARRARTERRVELIPGEDAMSTLAAQLPAELASAAYGRIDGMARSLRNKGDARTLDQLRADVYADLLLGNDPGAQPPAAAATVFLHLPATTALTIGDDGAELSGYGPLPGPIAREIMTRPNSVWRKVLTDPGTGAPMDLGATRRRPTQAIRDFVAVRDVECTVPGCHRPAQRCDFDHRIEWQHRPDTSSDNGAPKCEYHHYLKSQPDWHIDFDPNTGTATITTPSGRSYEHHPRPPRPTGADTDATATNGTAPGTAAARSTTASGEPITTDASSTGDDPPF